MENCDSKTAGRSSKETLKASIKLYKYRQGKNKALFKEMIPDRALAKYDHMKAVK